ncbi:MAG: hypothetical protein IK990_16305 [Ruminiclostridium sp.]|nr:hypothetical protein [Ruminiclostridium sp.]
MKKQRQAEILAIIAECEIENQEMLCSKLSEKGYKVTQATVSRDINELGLEKALSDTGVSCYMRAKKANKRHFESFFSQSVIHIDCAGNIVCVRCQPGLASAACATLDSMNMESVVGTVSGDDTIFILVRSENDAQKLASLLKNMI